MKKKKRMDLLQKFGISQTIQKSWEDESSQRLMGWEMGLEPTTTGITIRDSTN